MLIEILIGSGIGSGLIYSLNNNKKWLRSKWNGFIDLWSLEKFSSSFSSSPIPYSPQLIEIRFYDSIQHNQLLFTIPIHHPSNIETFETQLISLCQNPIFIFYMNNCNVKIIELYDGDKQCFIREFYLHVTKRIFI